MQVLALTKKSDSHFQKHQNNPPKIPPAQDPVEGKIYEAERRACERIMQKEKRNYMNDLLRETELDHTQGRIQNFFPKIKKYKQFNPILKAVEADDKILIEPTDKVTRWEKLL